MKYLTYDRKLCKEPMRIEILKAKEIYSYSYKYNNHSADDEAICGIYYLDNGRTEKIQFSQLYPDELFYINTVDGASYSKKIETEFNALLSAIADGKELFAFSPDEEDIPF